MVIERSGDREKSRMSSTSKDENESRAKVSGELD